MNFTAPQPSPPKNVVAQFLVIKSQPEFKPPSQTDIDASVERVEAARAAETAAAVAAQAEVETQAQAAYIAPALSDNQYKTFIYMHESGNRTNAINPSS